MTQLLVEGLVVEVGGSEILHGIDLEVRSGEVHAVMGPNGAGKTTLGSALMGHPGYEVTAGSVKLDGEELIGLPTWKRAVLGLFLGLQDPVELPGIRLDEFLAESLASTHPDSTDDRAAVAQRIASEAREIGLVTEVVARPVNVGASGGERKRLETLQLAVLEPAIAVLDELDSGLDIDALRDVARRIERAARPQLHAGNGSKPLGVLAITHYNRILTELRPDRVHVLVRGKIVESGGSELAEALERTGYAPYTDGETEE